MTKDLLVDITQRLPQGMLSRAWGFFARQKRPRLLVDAMKHTFVRTVGVDLSEAERPLASYDSLVDLFVRKLRPGVRRVDPKPDVVTSPVDGTVGMVGTIEQGTLLQAKGRLYSAARLLGSQQDAKRFEGGHYATIYLAPHNYHRVHAPVAGSIHEAVLIPGRLLPVYEQAVQGVDELFARNERLITFIDSPQAGRVAVVKVGAMLVGRITLTYDAHLKSNVAGQLRRKMRYEPPHRVAKGADLAAFEMGSTVVLLFEPGRVAAMAHLQPGATLRMGQAIGALQVQAGRAQAKSSTSDARQSSKAVKATHAAKATKRKPSSKKKPAAANGLTAVPAKQRSKATAKKTSTKKPARRAKGART